MALEILFPEWGSGKEGRKEAVISTHRGCNACWEPEPRSCWDLMKDTASWGSPAMGSLESLEILPAVRKGGQCNTGTVCAPSLSQSHLLKCFPPSVVLLGRGALGGDSVMRVQPS